MKTFYYTLSAIFFIAALYASYKSGQKSNEIELESTTIKTPIKNILTVECKEGEKNIEFTVEILDPKTIRPDYIPVEVRVETNFKTTDLMELYLESIEGVLSVWKYKYGFGITKGELFSSEDIRNDISIKLSEYFTLTEKEKTQLNLDLLEADKENVWRKSEEIAEIKKVLQTFE